MSARGVVISSLLIVISTMAVAQQAMVRHDTQFPVELRTETALSAAKPGTSLEFVTTEAVLIGHGIVVPKGAKVLGRVEEVQVGAADKLSSLRISFYALDWEHGSAPLNAVVMEVEPSDSEANPVWRHLRRAARGRPTMLEHVAVRSHVGREAYVDFESNGNFVLRHGVRFVLWQIDPEREPMMFARNPVLEVSSALK